MEANLKILKIYLEDNIDKLNGELVSKKSKYDSLICDKLTEFQVQTKRYWDAEWTDKNIYIEFKKGKSIWLDLVRYSEIKTKKNEYAKQETITLFFIPDKNKTRIEIIVGMSTLKLIENLKITTNDAKYIIGLNEKVPRSLNAQSNLTVNDVRKIADFIVTSSTL
jgi:hypothetical protein